MVRLFRTSLALKLVLLTALAVAAGFAAAVMTSASIQAKSVDRLHAENAKALAHTLAAGVRNSMLNGNGITVRHLVDDIQSGLGTATVRVFAPNGEEVFAAKPPPPPADRQPAYVHRVLTTASPANAPNDARAIPIANEPRCHGCHDQGQLRGVMTLGTRGAKVAIDGSDASLDALARIFSSGFVQLMTAKRDEGLDAYFAEATARTPGVRGVAVYDTGEQRSFGTVKLPVPDEAVTRGVTAGTAPFTVSSGALKYRVVPLPSEPRCKGCHRDPGETMRGALVVAFDPAALDGDATLLMASETALQHVMLSGLGRIVQGFLDDVAATGAVTSLTVHDAEGRMYHDAFGKPVPPSMVGQVLSTGVGKIENASLSHPEFLLAEPLANEKACQTCHGPDRPLRGAIEVRLDTSATTQEILSLRHKSEIYALATISFVILLLWGVLHFTVIAPVGKIGLVAELVGAGRFDAKVEVSSHDEIGRLGARMNKMVEGLRQKVALSRFVSRATVDSVERQADGNVSRGGARRRMTVLFSDIRGFTAFSESHEPEQVVEMLNHYLHAQAEIVGRHGGDIDKFVGDELMARFDGPDMEKRAIRCAVEMAEAVAELSRREGGHAISIGVGVNVGEMVFGAMGSESRMDFTVIGDAVNLGARLCSAAQASQVLVAGPVREAALGMKGVDFMDLDPIKVKGKQDPVAVFSVVPSASPALVTAAATTTS